MRRAHFEALAPICPACRHPEPLRLASVLREDGDHVLDGILQCTNPGCWREHPILDGVPVLVADLRAHLGGVPLAFLAREDLPDALESLLGDALGPSSPYDQQRQRQSIYVHGHWSDHDADPEPSAAAALVRACLALPGTSPLPALPALELGCGPGRGCLELAAHTSGLVLGLDLDFPAARFASRLLRTGAARYRRRHVGLVYAWRALALDAADPAARADVWMADALAPPFLPGRFGTVAAMNVLDSCPSPWGLLHAVADVLAPGGAALLATPYDWAPAATPPDQWLGGHSQRAADGGLSEAAVRACLTPGHPRHVPGLTLESEAADLPWRLRVHDRSEVVYRVHGMLARRG